MIKKWRNRTRARRMLKSVKSIYYHQVELRKEIRQFLETKRVEAFSRVYQIIMCVLVTSILVWWIQGTFLMQETWTSLILILVIVVVLCVFAIFDHAVNRQYYQQALDDQLLSLDKAIEDVCEKEGFFSKHEVLFFLSVYYPISVPTTLFSFAISVSLSFYAFGLMPGIQEGDTVLIALIKYAFSLLVSLLISLSMQMLKKESFKEMILNRYPEWLHGKGNPA